jgi:hypothetical protein
MIPVTNSAEYTDSVGAQVPAAVNISFRETELISRSRDILRNDRQVRSPPPSRTKLIAGVNQIAIFSCQLYLAV